MGKIRILDEHVANQIAAGEVVERPSSVVKELVENSIDAGSSRIDVSIEEGGLQSIRVTDNGSGMEADDCEIAFFRHATSKISSGKDLFSIKTLGFRGEALPSIAAVAKVECVTSSQTTGLGRKIVISGGAVQSMTEVNAPKGTDIVVKDLFYNTPARLKYMKTIQTELGHVSDYIYRLSLAHQDIAFTLKHNGNVLLQTLGNGDLLQVIAAIYGTSIAKSMIAVRAESLDYTLSGYIGKPEITRANRNAVSTFVNGRFIKNYTLAHAVMNGYHTLLPIHRYPIAVLHLQMEPSLVDVNVHPAKLEARFSKEAELTRFIENEIKQSLQKSVLIPAASKSAAVKPSVVQERMELYRPSSTQSDFQQNSVRSASVNNNQPASGSSMKQTGLKRMSDIRTSVQAETERTQNGSAIRLQSPQWNKRGAGSGSQWTDVLAGKSDDTEQVGPQFPFLHPIGQMHGTYIIAQNEQGLFLIDQHAAHERIHYEYYYERFGNPTPVSQELLVPIPLEFTPSEAETMKERLHLFAQVGVHLEHFGGHSFIVRAYPGWFPAGEEKQVIDEMAEWILSEKKSVDLAKFREKSAILCSCKASIKANQSLSTKQIEVLLDRLGKCNNPFTCPHGRPIVISFSTYELEKMFKRVL